LITALFIEQITFAYSSFNLQLTKFQNRQQQQRNMGSDMLDVEFLEQPSTNAAATASQPPSIGTQSMEQSLHSSRSSSFVNIDQTGISSLNDQNGSQQSAVR
jgi:hypothetical protein